MARGTGSVRVDGSGARATVEWDRPPVHVFDIALLGELARALRSDTVRSANVVVLRGAGHRFSAGFSVEDHRTERVRPMFSAFRDVLHALEEVPVPTVAQVEGPCLGGALEILLGCDLAIASSSATFGQPEIKLGVFPPLAAVWASDRLGAPRAAELLLLGETFSAERAESIGLLSRVVPETSIDEEVVRVAGRLGSLRRESLVLLKRAMRPDGSVPWSRLDRAEAIYLDQLMTLPHAEEGLRAFLEKREPVWPSPAP